VLEGQLILGFCDIVTGDESWFLEHYDHRQIWCGSADEAPTRAVHTIAAQKAMLAMLLSINGVIFINWLPPGETFNNGYFCEKCPSRFPRSCTAGVLHMREGRYCILTLSHLIGRL
jgi:hypothetical protein